MERTTASSGPPVVDEPDPCPSFTKKAKNFVSSLSTIIHTPPPSSESESSHARELDHLSRSFVDKSTLSVARSVDFVSDSLDKVEYTEAFDVISGENSIRRHAYSSAETVRVIQPKSLTLFKLIILADVVNRLYPRYSLLREQCFFFASVMVFAVEEICGVFPNQDHSDLADMNKAGRWKGFKVNVIDKGVITKIVRNFNVVHVKRVNRVSNLLLSNFSSTKLFNTDQEFMYKDKKSRESSGGSEEISKSKRNLRGRGGGRGGGT